MNEPTNEIRLLLVDDEDEFRAAAAQALTRQGFVVSQAESGERAVQMVAQDPPEVMILDLRMGGMDGIETLEKIRQQEPDLPVLILTGHGNYHDALAGLHLRIVDFVQKPVDLADLAQRIRRLLARGPSQTLREKRIEELMVPVDAYRKFYVDQSVQSVVAALEQSLFAGEASEPSGPGRRTVLVFDRGENFVGLIGITDLLRTMVPDFLQDSAYASFYTGMFLAQTKVIGKLPLGDVVSWHHATDLNTPLMEAVHAMAAKNLTVLPIMADGKLVGILRDQDLFRIVADSVLGK